MRVNKLFVITTICMIFLLASVSALEIDNKLTYQKGENGNPDLKVQLDNSFLGLIKTSQIGTAELKSHPSVEYVKKVGVGKQVVMYYDFNFRELYTNALGTPEFIDMKTGELVDREWRYVYWGNETYQEPTKYCLDVETSNGTFYPTCFKNGSIEKTRETWLPYNSLDIPKGKIKLGIEVEVRQDDYIDGIWTIGGKKIDRHAEWNAVGKVYYKSFVPSASFPDTGGTEFTDGTYPAAGTGNAGWFAIDTGAGGDILNITVDLGSDSKQIYNITAWMMTETTIGIYLPSNLTAWGSNDNSTFTLLGELTFNAGDNASAAARMGTLSPGNVDYRYIRYRGVQDQRWQFWGEGGINWTDSALIVTLLSPENNANFVTQNLYFVGNVSDPNSFGIDTVWLEINGTINQTNTSGLQGIYNFTGVTIPEGFWNYTIKANDTSGIIYNSTNGTLFFTVSDFIENSMTYNVSTFETASESFTANITTNGSVPTLGKLIYNDTTYSSVTITNEVGDTYLLSKTIDTPLNVTDNDFYFNFTLGGIEKSTNTYSQEVNLTLLTQTNATYTDTFLNITFKDENDLSTINASIPSSTFTYYLGSGSVNKTYTFIDNNNNYSFAFSGTTGSRDLYVTDISLQYRQVSDYPQRIWEPSTQTYNSTDTNQVLYLLNTNDGIYVTYQVLTLGESPIQGVDVVSTRVVSGETIQVGAGTTDAAGTVTFWENPDFQHTTTFTKTGYDTYTFIHFPTQNAYTITLGGTTSTENDYIQGVTQSINPSQDFLYQNEEYDFNYTINSEYLNLTTFQFTLSYSNGTTIGSNSSSGSNSGTISLNNINVSNVSTIIMTYLYEIDNDDATQISGTRVWILQSTTGTEYGIWRLAQDFNTYVSADLYGIDDFGKTLVSFVILVLMVGGLSRRYGLASEGAIMGILFGTVYMLDVGLGLIPRISFGDIQAIPHFITYITFIILLAIIIREERR